VKVGERPRTRRPYFTSCQREPIRLLLSFDCQDDQRHVVFEMLAIEG
jgi:hypothetical protein